MISTFEIFAGLVSLASLLAFANQRWLRQPPSIALMAMTLGASVLLLLAEKIGGLNVGPIIRLHEHIHLDEALLHGMLGALLFAGALHVPLHELRRHRLAVAMLALFGTLASTAIVAGLTHGAFRLLGMDAGWSAALLFGAIISPTDPVAVLGILKQAKVPRATEVQITGESLFNDGVGVVVFTTVLGIVRGGEATFTSTLTLFAREALGGALFGAVAGYIVYRLLRAIDHYQTELLLTIALVSGGYAAAERLRLSAPIAAVVSGLVIGNQGRERGMSDVTRDHLDKFWSLIDEILNAVLFVLVGLEVMRLPLSRTTVVAGVVAIPVALLGRWASVAGPIGILSRWSPFERGTVTILTWGGLRGGISVALALSLGEGELRDLLVTMTYFVVAFSILVQGMTLGRVASRFQAGTGATS